MGYTVDVPENIQELKHKLLEGNSKEYSSDANVVHKTSVDDYVSQSRWLSEVEDIWGVAPGKIDTDGESIYVQGLTLGNVFIGVQPSFGFEGDPMRLLLEKGTLLLIRFAIFINICGTILKLTFYCIMEPMEL